MAVHQPQIIDGEGNMGCRSTIRSLLHRPKPNIMIASKQTIELHSDEAKKSRAFYAHTARGSLKIWGRPRFMVLQTDEEKISAVLSLLYCGA